MKNPETNIADKELSKTLKRIELWKTHVAKIEAKTASKIDKLNMKIDKLSIYADILKKAANN